MMGTRQIVILQANFFMAYSMLESSDRAGTLLGVGSPVTG
jgi:hypothetical protein